MGYLVHATPYMGFYTTVLYGEACRWVHDRDVNDVKGRYSTVVAGEVRDARRGDHRVDGPFKLTVMAANKYPGMCGTCELNVPAGAGSLTKANGRWITYHSQCVPVPRAPEPGDHDGWHRGVLAAFDIESTGVRVNVDRVVSASVRDTSGTCVDVLIDPGVEIPAEATATHGITTQQARAHGVSPQQGLNVVADTLAGYVRAGVPIVIYNAVYDVTLLSCELVRHGLVPLADRCDGHEMVIVDPLVVDRQVDRFRSGGRTLEAVCSFYGVRHPGPHRADADTQACLDLAIAIAARYPQIATMPPALLHTEQVDWFAERVNYMAGRYPDREFDPRWPVGEVSAQPWALTQPLSHN